MFKRFICLALALCCFKSAYTQIPVNDDCSDAIDLFIDGPTLSGTTIGATGPHNLVCGGGIDDDVWYKFVATVPQLRITVTPDTSGSFTPLRDPIYEIYTGTDCFSQSFVDCAHVYWSSVLTKRSYPFTLGNTYYIRVYSTFDNINDRGNFRINITSAPWAANYSCVTATTLTPSLSNAPNYISGSTLNGADNQTYCTSNYYSQQNVWYDFTVNSRFNRIKILQNNTPSNIYATVFSKDCSTSFPVVRNCSTDSVISLNDFLAGEQISIRLNSRSTIVNNNFSIGVYTDSLKNDACINAIPVIVENDAYQPAKYYTTLDATQSAAACDTTIPIKDVWFKFTAPAIPFEIVIDNINCNIESQLYSGSCAGLASVLCQKRDNLIIPQNLIAGNVYYLRVYGTSTIQPLQFFIKAFVTPPPNQNSLVDTSCVLPNLVFNPGFELYSECPVSFTPTASPGNSLIPGWTFPTLGTTDYFNSCADYSSPVHVPRNNCVGKQIPRNGKGYAGFFVFNNGDNAREYLGGTLLQPMIPGKKYLVSFWINLGDQSEFGMNRIGVYFSTSPYTMSTYLPIPVTPQVVSPFGQFFTDKERWVNVSAFYYPDQAYTHFIIGNFLNDTATQTLHTPYTKNGAGDVGCDIYNCSYLLIDDVTIAEVKDPSQCSVLPLTLLDFTAVKINSKAVKLDWKTTQETNVRLFEVERANDGVHFSGIGIVNANNNSTAGVNHYQLTDASPLTGNNFYRLKIIDHDGSFKYSNTRLVKFDTNSTFTLFPNPFQDHFTIVCNEPAGSFSAYDTKGRLMQKGNLKKGLNPVNTGNWSRGLYFINIIPAGQTIQSQKILKL